MCVNVTYWMFHHKAQLAENIVNLIVEKYLNLKQSIEANLHVLQVIYEIKIIQKVIVKKVNYHKVKLLT